MIVILYAVMLMQALSLPPLHKRYAVLNPSNHFYRLTPLIELGSRKPSDYRIIIEASSTKVKQCFYYINADEELKSVCKKQPDGDEPIEDITNLANKLKNNKPIEKLIDVTKELTDKLRSELDVDYEEKNYVAVDILGTAGMRKKTLTGQTEIWSKFIEVWEKNQKDTLLQLNTIQDTSGVEEGIYGCMIANVALGNLDLSLNLPKKAVNTEALVGIAGNLDLSLNAPKKAANIEAMVGIVEIGGASAQIAVPIKKGTSFNDFNNFHSRSIPFGKNYFWADVMKKKMPLHCKYPTSGHPASFAECCAYVLKKIKTKEDSLKNKDKEASENEKRYWNLPKDILEFSHYYLLGGTWGYAWAGDTIEKNMKRTKKSFYKDGQQIVNIAVLEEWTKAMCADSEGAEWQKGEKAINGHSEMACYSSVYAYSFLKHFFEDKQFYIDQPLSTSHLVSNKDVDWPSAAYLYLKSHAYDLPSSEVSVTIIKDDQYEKS